MSDDIEEQLSKVHIQELTGENENTVSESDPYTPKLSDEYLEEFLSFHSPQLQVSGVPEHFWPSLCLKLGLKQYDAGAYFEMLCEDEEGTPALCCHARALSDIDPANSTCIYLIDHALTFKPKTLRYALHQLPAELQRFKEMFGIETDGEANDNDDDVVVQQDSNESHHKDKDMPHSASDSSSIYETARKSDDDTITKLLQVIWKRAETYNVSTNTEEFGEEHTSIWYLMDEFGMSIGHSSTPNFRVVPFFYAYDNSAYSLLFPIKAVSKGDMITRDYLTTQVYKKHPEWKSTLLIPWTPQDLSEISLPRCEYPDSYFVLGRQVDSLPDKDVERRSLKATDTLKIYADDTQLIEHLRRVKYELVDDLAQADVVWMRSHFYDFKNLAHVNPKALTNQFPYENLLTVKDLLAACITSSDYGKGLDESTLEYSPSWLPTTFNLELELPQFVSHFQKREKRGLDNSWIIKPWNLARGLDMNVTDNLDFIIRLVDTGPKIACKYIERPLLITRPDNGNNVKFDLRYIVFLRSVQPLDLCIYKNFWIRFGIKEFSLMHLDCNDTHFTVHNYGEAGKVYQMNCHTFMTLVENRYPQLKWANVQKKINDTIKGVFTLLAENPRPMNIVHNNQSRAMYGLDIMLKWNDQEEKDLGISFIEANFMPDCNRACQYYPDFADTVFETLFTDSPLSDQIQQL